MDAEKQYQQRRHQRTATHAGQTHDGTDDKTGERIEPVHGRYDSALVHHWNMIRGSEDRASMLAAQQLAMCLIDKEGDAARLIANSMPCVADSMPCVYWRARD
jgi:hypothetical protein